MKHYAILGYPLKHTMSPPIHKRLFELSGVEDYDYTIREIPPEALEENIPSLFKTDGFNITIPHKISIIKYLDSLDASAQRYDSVNCVAVHDGKHIGYNTDCDGFLRSLKAQGISLGGKVLQCGCGGVGRMMAIEAVRAGAELTVSVLEGFENTVDPVREYAEKNGIDSSINVIHPDEISGSFDLLVNASPVGMFPKTDACPVSEDIVKHCGYVFDVIYNPEVTKLMSIAKKHGIGTTGGMAMLVWQAVVAHEYWDGSTYSNSDIEQLIADMHELMRNKE
ncbi:MAG: shikimate dehydrogenase [Oscillospiraceae bacterium]|nr:shikimate dehydrogenase [Oscillospiraceae bacterium]